ncbi:LacI family DNA-binding transcriptional regulator [Priestia aryabhattai]|uniref:LacI family DNA-binding transcriptional regulator n=1 Tax=Priestia TaxID=2800373 RepID=UPI001EB32699|nr:MULTISPECIES: LacI family DNA-binding transcriptional regulator [Priestia]MBY0094598.1 LacI family DNA-binding transcriptional regulator [Priestia aryabhattai]MBY0104279.1 LacI family DNA-binding transcriptional regulator [Priestia aryabhattai]MCM3307981.1 LacI family transcriptional regulator [Priestia megaterium]
MKPTIYSVAEEAGVSISTVSKVINQTGHISERTRQKVIEVMAQLNYHPSVVASALTGKPTKTIGLLVPDISNPFFADLARSIEDRSHERGFHVVMCNTDNDAEKEKKYLSLLIRQRIDGLIVASAFRNANLLKNMLKQDIPISVIASEIPHISVNTVTVDDYKGSYLAADYLLSLHHKKIAIITENAKSNHARLDAFRDAMQAAKEFKIDVPQDLSVIGFDNTVLSTTITPMLTTVAQPTKEMAVNVVDLLVREMKYPAIHKEHLLLEPKLIVRKSTAPLRRNATASTNN